MRWIALPIGGALLFWGLCASAIDREANRAAVREVLVEERIAELERIAIQRGDELKAMSDCLCELSQRVAELEK